MFYDHTYQNLLQPCSDCKTIRNVGKALQVSVSSSEQDLLALPVGHSNYLFASTKVRSLSAGKINIRPVKPEKVTRSHHSPTKATCPRSTRLICWLSAWCVVS